MKTLNYMGEKHTLLTESEELFLSELKRQFGKDAKMFALAPHKYVHHFDKATLQAYQAIKE